MGKLTLTKKVLIGFLIWAGVMLVLGVIYAVRVYQAQQAEHAVQFVEQENTNYQNQAGALLNQSLELQSFSQTLVLPQVDTTLRLE
jgi:cell division protein FtsL